jgi:two-component system response regulator QseB
MSARVLLIEDDPLLGDGIREGLLDAGFTVDWVRDGREGATALQVESTFDALILDLGLPGMDGLTVLRQLRGRDRGLPVLILTARDAIEDRITGLDSGADDYVVKPFALGELAARLRALIRRQAGAGQHVLQHGRIALDPSKKVAFIDSELMTLTAREYQILWLLMRSFPHLLSREQIEQRIYGWDGGNESNSLEVHLSHLRKKLGGQAIINVRGLGWRLADA